MQYKKTHLLHSRLLSPHSLVGFQRPALISKFRTRQQGKKIEAVFRVVDANTPPSLHYYVAFYQGAKVLKQQLFHSLGEAIQFYNNEQE